MIRRRFWTGALISEPVASAATEVADGSNADDELIEPCSVDEEVFSRVRPSATEADVLASVEAVRKFGTVRGCIIFDDDETSENLPSYSGGDGSISLSFEKVNAKQKGTRKIDLSFLFCPCQKK